MPTIDIPPPMIAGTISERLQAVVNRVQEAVRRADRPEGCVRLVAVSKFQNPAVVDAALLTGHRCFGESRIQEASGKWSELRPRYSEIELHLIGRLQSNKARAAVALFDVIQTIDRPEIAAVLGTEMQRLGRRPACLIQVNTGREPQKAGILPESADGLIEESLTKHHLPIQGLMCIPPEGADPQPHFELLGRIARRNGLPLLSMGMSQDFELAIAHGATHVRVGTAIFGTRLPSTPDADSISAP